MEKKVKKKTLITNKTKQYLEAVVYIVAIIVVIFANNYGNIYIRMLPLLFILGVVGKLVFDRPVITTIFGMITSICIVKLSGQNVFMNNLFISLCVGLHIALGELFGQYLEKAYKYVNKKKKLKNKGVLSTYISVICIFVVFVLIHNYTNGNIFGYTISKQILYRYLSETYDTVEDFKILDVHYEFYNSKDYVFEIRDSKRQITSRFIVYTDKSKYVYDEYKTTLLEKNNNKLKQEFDLYLKEIQFDGSVDVDIEYIDVDNAKLSINKKYDNITNENKLTFVDETVEFIKSIRDFKKFSNIEKLSLLIDSSYDKRQSLMSVIDMNAIAEILDTDDVKVKEYILKSLNIEFIDAKNN